MYILFIVFQLYKKSAFILNAFFKHPLCTLFIMKVNKVLHKNMINDSGYFIYFIYIYIFYVIATIYIYRYIYINFLKIKK